MGTDGVGTEMQSMFKKIGYGLAVIAVVGAAASIGYYRHTVNSNTPAHLRQYDWNSDGIDDLVLQNAKGKTLEVFFGTKDRGYLTLDEIKLDNAQQ